MEYRSNEELFDAIKLLQKELAATGSQEASALISEGMSGLNGLTDGWAYLLEHLNVASQKYGSSFSSQQSKKLAQIQSVIHKVVHRA